jgi:hypothetical protein
MLYWLHGAKLCTLGGCDFFGLKTNTQIRKYAKEPLGIIFLDGVFCIFRLRLMIFVFSGYAS